MKTVKFVLLTWTLSLGLGCNFQNNQSSRSIAQSLLVKNYFEYINLLPEKAEQLDWSDILKPIETNQNILKQIIAEENKNTHLIFPPSSLRKKIESILSKRMSSVRVIQSVTLHDGLKINLVDQGLGKSIDLVQIENKIPAATTKLLSNFNYKKNNSLRFEGFSISPDERYIIISGESNGSIDDVPLFVFDLKTKKWSEM